MATPSVYESFDFLLYEYEQNLLNLEGNYGKVMAVNIENHMHLGY